MNLSSKKNYVLILMLLVFGSVLSQREASWSLDLASRIKEIITDPITGIVVVETADKISAISPETKDVIWAHNKKDLNANNIEASANAMTVNVDASSFLTKNMDIELIPDTKLFFLTKGEQFFILDIITGEIKLNSVTEGISLISKFFIPESDFIIALVKKDLNYLFIGFETKTYSKVWEEQIDQSFLREFFNFSNNDNPSPKVDKDGNFLIVFNRKLYKVDKDTGAIVWQRGERVKFFDYNAKNDVVVTYNTQSLAKKALRAYLLSFKEKGEIEVINNANGELNFDPMKIKNFKYAEDFGDDMLLVSGKRFNRYKYSNGEKVWEKSPKGKNFSGVIKTSLDTYIFTANDEIMHIDQDGKKMWKRPRQITDEDESETLILEETEKGNVVYITETHANILDLKTGNKQWKRDLKLRFHEKKPTLAFSDYKTSSYYIYNNDEFFTFDENNAERPEKFAKINIKREKQVNGLYNIDDLIVVTGIGEILGLDKNGNQKYYHFYREPGGFGRTFTRYATGTTALFMDAYANSTYSVNGGPEKGLFVRKGSQKQKNLNVTATGLYAVSASVKNRFDASKNLEKYSYFFTKEGRGEEKLKVLIKVDRSTGEEVDKVVFYNNRPKYDIDVYTHTIYYAKDTTLLVYE